MARCFGLMVNILSAKEAGDLWPVMAIEDLVVAVYLPKDGQANPVDTTQALAKGRESAAQRLLRIRP